MHTAYTYNSTKDFIFGITYLTPISDNQYAIVVLGNPYFYEKTEHVEIRLLRHL